MTTPFEYILTEVGTRITRKVMFSLMIVSKEEEKSSKEVIIIIFMDRTHTTSHSKD